jgi:hypothetical protein
MPSCSESSVKYSVFFLKPVIDDETETLLADEPGLIDMLTKKEA